jgi:hypothetical protein
VTKPARAAQAGVLLAPWAPNRTAGSNDRAIFETTVPRSRLATANGASGASRNRDLRSRGSRRGSLHLLAVFLGARC